MKRVIVRHHRLTCFITNGSYADYSRSTPRPPEAGHKRHQCLLRRRDSPGGHVDKKGTRWGSGPPNTRPSPSTKSRSGENILGKKTRASSWRDDLDDPPGRLSGFRRSRRRVRVRSETQERSVLRAEAMHQGRPVQIADVDRSTPPACWSGTRVLLDRANATRCLLAAKALAATAMEITVDAVQVYGVRLHKGVPVER